MACTLVGVGGTRKKEVVQVVVDWTDPLLDGYPLQGICQAVEDKGG